MRCGVQAATRRGVPHERVVMYSQHYFLGQLAINPIDYEDNRISYAVLVRHVDFTGSFGYAHSGSIDGNPAVSKER